jgi:hypothetical protein
MTRRSLLPLIIVIMMPFFGIYLHAADKGGSESPEGGDTCVSCHDAQAVDALKKPVTEWRASVHSGPGKKCSLCHGGDPGAADKLAAHSVKANFTGKPAGKASPEFCGRAGCHSTALEQFRRGPHYPSVQKSGEPACTSCHGVHNVQRSSVEVISAKSCTACHQADYSRDMVKLITGIDKSIGAIDRSITILTDKHADVTGLQNRLSNARHMFHQFVHVFSRQDMEFTKKMLEMEIASLDMETKTKVSSIQRMDLLYYAMLALGLAIIVGILTYMLVMYGKRRK